jgi:outer membrane lipopolysaccharide assembly protein LptE/RlpB
MKKLTPLVAIAALLVLTGCGQQQAPRLSHDDAMELCVERKVLTWETLGEYADESMRLKFAVPACEQELAE